MEDRLGATIEVGDVVVYTTNSKGGGGLTIGVIEKFHDDKGMTIKSRWRRDQYAFEVGAPDIIQIGERYKRAPDGRYVIPYTVEKYKYTIRDYSKTGKIIYYWAKTVIWTPRNVIVLQKSDLSYRKELRELITLDYTKTEEQLNGNGSNE